MTVFVLYGCNTEKFGPLLRHPVIASMGDVTLHADTRRILSQERAFHLPAMLDVSRWFAIYEELILLTARRVSEGLGESGVVLIDTECRETALSFALRVGRAAQSDISMSYEVMPTLEYAAAGVALRDRRLPAIRVPD